MTPEQLIKSWCDDSATHALVWADDWTSESRGLQRPCEACGRLVSVWPVVVQKKVENPRLHVICRAKCMAVSIKVSGKPLPFGGRISNNTLPDSLKEFGK